MTPPTPARERLGREEVIRSAKVRAGGPLGPRQEPSPFVSEPEALLVPAEHAPRDTASARPAPPTRAASPAEIAALSPAALGPQTTAPSAPATLAAQAQAAPTIRVSIGRIEVRAAPPPAPAPSPERPRPQLLGLQDYLAQQGARR